jgi:hypothetical protein
LLVCLITAHFIGDFLLQTDKEANNKTNFFFLVKHTVIVSIISYIICGAWTIWQIPVIIFITHTVIDYVKTIFKRKTVCMFLIDQSAHLVVIIVLVMLISAGDSISLFWNDLFGDTIIKLLIIITGTIAVIKTGSVLIGIAVEPFLNEIEKSSSEKKQQEDKLNRGLKNGGSTIGRLERGLILIFVLVGHPEAIGFLIAAKSIFRFGEIKESKHRMEAEYILIGTLMSFGYGILISYATKYFLSLV